EGERSHREQSRTFTSFTLRGSPASAGPSNIREKRTSTNGLWLNYGTRPTHAGAGTECSE
ncbi:hypothetical protein, partial [Mesorhizobium japonicum]|uniref:hypothetical protein n=1 Tax=Mesorhizobium japonicum TaxID=2066070 RepID=UPI003B5BE817